MDKYYPQYYHKTDKVCIPLMRLHRSVPSTVLTGLSFSYFTHAPSVSVPVSRCASSCVCYECLHLTLADADADTTPVHR